MGRCTAFPLWDSVADLGQAMPSPQISDLVQMAASVSPVASPAAAVAFSLDATRDPYDEDSPYAVSPFVSPSVPVQLAAVRSSFVPTHSELVEVHLRARFRMFSLVCVLCAGDRTLLQTLLEDKRRHSARQNVQEGLSDVLRVHVMEGRRADAFAHSLWACLSA